MPLPFFLCHALFVSLFPPFVCVGGGDGVPWPSYAAWWSLGVARDGRFDRLLWNESLALFVYVPNFNTFAGDCRPLGMIALGTDVCDKTWLGLTNG